MEDPQPLQNIKRVLIANRGEIAVRCIRACERLGVTSVAIYTRSDASSLHVTSANESVLLAGDETAGYLDIDDIISKCKQLSIDAVIPGYGFLSENVQFAQRVTDAGMVFVGPSSESITEMGLKHRAREVALQARVPIVPGTDLLVSETQALAEADRLNYPVMLKATGGGGGMGLQICHSPEDVRAAFDTVIEECPSPFVQSRPGLRQRLVDCATKYASALNYKSAGTVEFLLDDETGEFFFLEMNTRLQVEHGITEMCYGVDLVVLMLQQADAERAGWVGIPSSELCSLQRPCPNGSAIEARIYAEDPYRGFAPSPGIFQQVKWPEEEGIRIDTWVQSGQNVSLYYDPLLAKVMVHAPTREQAIAKMEYACSQGIALRGPTTNLDFVRAIIVSDTFAQGKTLTSFLDTSFVYQPWGIDVISGGSYSTIQDFPGRPSIGHGIPKGGPMDSLSARIANILVGNSEGKEVIESTLRGPELLFVSAAVVAVCGASARVTVDGVERPMWSTLVVQSGQTLKIGSVDGAGCRVYIAVKGGFPSIPVIMGSKSTVPSLNFGGCQGRPLRQGDFLKLEDSSAKWATKAHEYSLPSNMIPDMDIKEVYVMQGPHDSQDIMTAEDRNMLYTTPWKVGHNSSRTGIRMVGPAPQWARADGGEAGSHPSNYLDYGYPSPGGVNWGGDSPCIFSADSPNFGGLVCSSTVISAELWKLGQLKPGDSFRMTPVSLEFALEQIHRIEAYISTVEDAFHKRSPITVAEHGLSHLPRCEPEPHAAILKVVQPAPGRSLRPKVTYRQGGDRFLLLEFGEQKTDVAVLARIHLLMEKLRADTSMKLLTPHAGSLMIEYDPLQIAQKDILARVHEIESSIEPSIDIVIPCREFRLPLVMDHPAIQECVVKYMNTTRDKAAYLPDNLDFLRKCNGLKSRREVFEVLLNTNYLAVAVGFLCGAPVLYPLDPKTISCPKYNPLRVSTPGGTLGIGGSLLNAYPTEQPGGYMMAARTLELWDPYGTKPGFGPDRPWLFEPFDKIKFYEVSIEEYDALSLDFSAGKYHWKISPSTFDLRQAYDMFQTAQEDSDIIEYKKRQTEGLAEQDREERKAYAEWRAATVQEDEIATEGVEMVEADNPNSIAITSPMAATLWKLEVKPGDKLKEGQVVAVLEAMKMEVNIMAPKGSDGYQVHTISRKPGKVFNAGDIILVAKRPV